MEYAEWLEHAQTFLRAWELSFPSSLKATIETELAAERKRGELAQAITEPFRCAYCGEVIEDGRHICQRNR